MRGNSTLWYVIGGVVLVIVIGVGYYALSPLWNNIAVDDELPMAQNTGETSGEEAAGASDEASEGSGTGAQQEEESSQSQTTVSGPFPIMDTQLHPASGSVRVFETDGSVTIRYEDFETINGPNLHVYVAKDLEANEFVDLGPIKGTEGNINYTVPAGVDLSEYRYVMYWCVPFDVLFNYAELR